jgi:hypothetical protein
VSIDLDEQAIGQTFRVTGDPSWRVLKFWKGQWVVAFYCSTEDRAYRQLEKCVDRAMKWSRMTPDERILATLR